MGLQAVDPLTASAAAGQRVVTPTGMVLDGATDPIKRSLVTNASEDPDLDGKVNEIPTSLVDSHGVLPVQLLQAGSRTCRRTSGQIGQNLLNQIGCTGLPHPEPGDQS